jgi:hypothetical protein
MTSPKSALRTGPISISLGGAQWGEGVVTVIAGDVVLSGTLLEEFATDIWLGKGAIGGIQLISSVGDSMSFHLDEASNEATATVPSELIIDRIPFEVRPWLRYRLSLQLQDSKLVSTLSYPVIVSYIESELPGFGAAAAIDNLIAFTAGKTRFTVLDDGSQDRTSEFDTPTSEIRVWSTDDGNRMGLCFPDQNRVLIGRPSVSSFSGTLTWPQETAQTSIVLGTGAGHEDGALFFPLSVDRGPDGRYFVLDAGNARIQVFDAEGNYLTQWGRDGFDFGNGNVSTDFVGSIAVDDDGFICVADVGNRRTQKFAPESLDKWRLLPTRHVAQHFHHLLRR